MNHLKCLLAVAVAFCGADTFAADPLLGIDEELNSLVGEHVMAEGLAWGAGAKGLGERIVLPSGSPLYFTGARYRDQHKNGRTVRVIGRLTIEKVNRAPEGAQGYRKAFSYYALDVETIEVIEEVQIGSPVALKIGKKRK